MTWLKYITDTSWNKHRGTRHNIYKWIHSEVTNISTIDDNIGEGNNFQARKYRISLVLEENELNTYISGGFPIPEGDEAKILTPEELGQGQEDHCWFNQGSYYTISVFPKDTWRDVWFLDQAIRREEHKLEDDFKKPVEECEDPECWDHTVILYKGLSNQRTTWSSRRISGERRSCDNYLEWPPRIMGFIHSRNVC